MNSRIFFCFLGGLILFCMELGSSLIARPLSVNAPTGGRTKITFYILRTFVTRTLPPPPFPVLCETIDLMRSTKEKAMLMASRYSDVCLYRQRFNPETRGSTFGGIALEGTLNVRKIAELSQICRCFGSIPSFLNLLLL